MYKTGHWGASLLLYAPVGYALAGVRPAFAVVGGAVVLALARLPDIDHRLPLVMGGPNLAESVHARPPR